MPNASITPIDEFPRLVDAVHMAHKTAEPIQPPIAVYQHRIRQRPRETDCPHPQTSCLATLALLGVDFLKEHNLLVDITSKQLIPKPPPHHHHNSRYDKPYPSHQPAHYQQYATFYRSSQWSSKTTCSMTKANQRSTTSSTTQKRKVTQSMPASDIWPQNNSPTPNKYSGKWRSQEYARKLPSHEHPPLHTVPNPNGTWGLCRDYWQLNVKTKLDRYPLPNIADTTNQMNSAKVFTKIDLLKGYFQITVVKKDIEKTAIITPFGTYTFNYSCFGLRNAGAAFQRLMDDFWAIFSSALSTSTTS
ncbi:uncharacterized protein [Macrobrachium rosenbergii]|uniref:uncharacterized protein n=1 Tax=Macrobrachium rosenbergii TaxID=79674 RepID=UPI0034D6ADC4